MTGIHRWRGYHLLEGIISILNGTTRMQPLNQPLHAKPTRGMYHQPTGKYDLNAGPREHPTPPQGATIQIPSLPGYEGEEILITARDMRQIEQALREAGLWHDLRTYALMDATWKIASYWPSRGMIAWSNKAPKPLRTLCVELDRLEPPSTPVLDEMPA